MKYLVVFFCFLFLPGFLLANALVDISGVVVDRCTNQKLPGANISVKNTPYGTSSDDQGYFHLSLSADTCTLEISYIGYQTKQITLTLTENNQTKTLRIELEPGSVSGEKVVISDKRESLITNPYQIKAREIKRMASPLPDVLVSLKTLPGVSSHNDQSSFYNVHGGNYDENLIYINGTEIYQPHLVRKGIAENPSLINPHLVKDINLRTGAFPVSYGDKLSSALDIRYGLEQEKKFTGTLELSTIGGNATVQSKINNSISLLTGVRKINYGYLFKKLPTSGNYAPDFEDFQTLVQYQPNNRLNITGFILAAQSQYLNAPTEWTFLNGAGNRGTKPGYYRSLFDGQEKYSYDTSLFSLSFYYSLRKNLVLSMQGSYFSQRENENTDVAEILLHAFDVYAPPTLNDYDDKIITHRKVDTHLNATYIPFKASLDWDVSPLLNVLAGMDYKSFTIDDHIDEQYMEIGEEGAIYLLPDANYQIQSDRQGTILAQYIQFKSKPVYWLTLQSGLRWTTPQLSNEQLFLPRFHCKFDLATDHRFYISAGRYAQPPIYKEFQFRKKDDDGLLSQKAWVYAVGTENQISSKLQLKLETYYKSLSDIISYTVNDVKIRYSGQNNGTGYAYGMDVYLRGEIVPGTENWFSYSYLKAREKLSNGPSGYIPRPSDRTHMFAVYMEDRMDRLPNSKLHLRFVYGSGYPFTWQNYIFNSNTQQYELVKGKRNQMNLPAYNRFDVGFTQQFTFHGIQFILREEVLNVFNHYNILGYRYTATGKVDYRLSNRLFNLGIQCEF